MKQATQGVNYDTLKSLLLSDLGPIATTTLSDPGMDPKDVAKKALLDSFYKKLLPTGDTSVPDAKALEKFLAINARFAEKFTPDGFTGDDKTLWDYFSNNFRNAVSPTEEDMMVWDDNLKDYVNQMVNFDHQFIFSEINPGPGSAQKADSRTFVSKLFESTMSWCNSEYLITLYRTACSQSGFWADAEMHRYQKFGFVQVKGGKIFFAKKNAEISRTCCTPANCNMLFQKPIGAFFERRLAAYFGIRLSKQPDNNRMLAKIGSENGSFGTIDLVSASDCMQLELIIRLMPEGLLKALMLMSREEFAVLPNGDEVKLNMISTMGNGFTFPLQTLVFACAVKAVYQLMGLRFNSPRSDYGVFGDDIIVRREAYDNVVRFLSLIGFEVNVGKSFNDGPFRESCGHDFYAGYFVRGVYIKSLETPQLICSAINRLRKWSVAHGIRLTASLAYLRQLVPKAPLVPPSESDDAGIQVPFVCSTPKVDNSGSYRFTYKGWKVHPKRITIEEPDQTINPSGSACGFLAGHYQRPELLITTQMLDADGWLLGHHDRKVTVSLRDNPDALPRYKIRKSHISFWDYESYGSLGDQARHRFWVETMSAIL